MPGFAAPGLGPGAVHCEAIHSLFLAHPDLIRVAEIEPSSGWIKAPGPEGAIRSNALTLELVAGLPQAKLVHGIGWPIGGTVCPASAALDEQKRWSDTLDAPWTSEHLSFNDSAAGPAGFLLPPAQSEAGIAVAAANIRARTAALGRPFAFETGVNYLPPRADEIPDGDYFAAVAEAADCLILLDLHNLWANARNGRGPIERVLAALPPERIVEIHLAGGMEKDGYWLDAHSGPVPPELIDLAGDFVQGLPNLGAILFEISPQFVDALGPADFLRQIESMNALWEQAGRRPSSSGPGRVRPVAGTEAPAAYEAALVRALGGPPEPGEPAAVALYRTLVASFRNGALADLLPYSLRLLARHLGEAGLEALLAAYRRSEPPPLFPADEALAFADWLRANGPRPAYLDDLLRLEGGIVRLVSEGRDGELRFRHDPSAIVGALAAGGVPKDLPEGDYCLRLGREEASEAAGAA
ncbi:MAG: uncharacterized protein QOJ91_1038 [Sphingomonadales bacterium]|jgi:uncharacterized protein (UPF0276 family)|nr:uncharacterized protein [Sphingomonadales bacterium]